MIVEQLAAVGRVASRLGDGSSMIAVVAVVVAAAEPRLLAS